MSDVPRGFPWNFALLDQHNLERLNRRYNMMDIRFTDPLRETHGCDPVVDGEGYPRRTMGSPDASRPMCSERPLTERPSVRSHSQGPLPYTAHL